MGIPSVLDLDVSPSVSPELYFIVFQFDSISMFLARSIMLFRSKEIKQLFEISHFRL